MGYQMLLSFSKVKDTTPVRLRPRFKAGQKLQTKGISNLNCIHCSHDSDVHDSEGICSLCGCTEHEISADEFRALVDSGECLISIEGDALDS
jgi:hypothetical protein